jgi:hypothetical protein
MDPADVDAERLRRAVLTAMRMLYREDTSLLEERAHERSVMFHVGRRLAASVGRWNDGWHVDLDYNRASEPGTKTERVRKYLPDSDREPDADGRHRREVIPDLVVHRRLPPAAADTSAVNLLVMECKWGSAGRQADYGKLRGYQEVFGYRVAAHLELTTDPRQAPSILWCDSLGGSRLVLLGDVAPMPMW